MEGGDEIPETPTTQVEKRGGEQLGSTHQNGMVTHSSIHKISKSLRLGPTCKFFFSKPTLIQFGEINSQVQISLKVTVPKEALKLESWQ